MLPCKDIVRILSSEEETSLMVTAEIKMHLLMCKHCSAYNKHLQYMKNGFKKLFSKLTRVEKSSVENLENQIIKKVANHK